MVLPDLPNPYRATVPKLATLKETARLVATGESYVVYEDNPRTKLTVYGKTPIGRRTILSLGLDEDEHRGIVHEHISGWKGEADHVVGPVRISVRTFLDDRDKCNAIGPQRDDGGSPFCIQDDGHQGPHVGYKGESWTDEEATTVA